MTEIDEIAERKVTAVSPALKRLEGATHCLSQLEDAVMCGLLEHPFIGASGNDGRSTPGVLILEMVGSAYAGNAAG